MINKIDDGSASLTFPDFCLLIAEKSKELDPETHFKDTFRAFSKDEEGKYGHMRPREAIKNVTKVEKVQKGGGWSVPESKQSAIQNEDYFEMSGGLDVQIFPNSNDS